MLQAGRRAHGGQRAGGAIVTISSVDGIVPCLGTGYDSAKAALFQFTRSLAVDLAPFGIRELCRAGERSGRDDPADEVRELPKLWDEPSVPTGLMGPMATSRSSNIPLGRKGRPEEISHAVLYLLQPCRALRHRPDAGGRRRLDARVMGAADDTWADEKAIIDLTVAYAWALDTRSSPTSVRCSPRTPGTWPVSTARGSTPSPHASSGR